MLEPSIPTPGLETIVSPIKINPLYPIGVYVPDNWLKYFVSKLFPNKKIIDPGELWVKLVIQKNWRNTYFLPVYVSNMKLISPKFGVFVPFDITNKETKGWLYRMTPEEINLLQGEVIKRYSPKNQNSFNWYHS